MLRYPSASSAILSGLLLFGCGADSEEPEGNSDAAGGRSGFGGMGDVASSGGVMSFGGSTGSLAGGSGGVTRGVGGFSAGGITSGGAAAGGIPGSGGGFLSGGALGVTGGASGTTGGASAMGGSGTGGAPGGWPGYGGSPGFGGSAAGGGFSVGGSVGEPGGGAGGSPGAGGTGPGGSPGSGGSDPGGEWFPCDGDASTYDAVVTESGGSWTVQGGGRTVYTGSDMQAAIEAALGSLSSGRTSKESVLVVGSGNIPASSRISLPSQTILNVCGTMNVTGSGSGDMAPLYARGRTDIDIPNVRITGTPPYGMFFRDVSNLLLGRIELVLDGVGLGIRIDNHGGNRAVRVQNVQIDSVYVENSGNHGVETYGVDNLTIGEVVGVDTANCGLILNDTVNAEVGRVECDNCAHVGTGYAAFRIANSAGKIGDEWPAGNIHVGEVVARRGGRGIFSVSGSGGLTIDRIDIANTGNNPILLQNCYNTIIAAESGTVTGGSVLLSNDSENTNNGVYEPSRNVTLQNLQLSGATVSEAWCELGDRGNRAHDISGGSVNMCFGD